MRPILKDPIKIVPLCIAALFFLSIYLNSFPCIAKVLFYPLYREVKKELFIIDSMDCYVKKTDNFNIYYKDAEYEYIDMIGDTAEKSLEKVIEDFNYKVKGKINIIVYSEYKEMAEKIGLSGTGSAAMGVYYGGTISILEPSKWINDKDNIAEIFEKQGPVLHELTHYVLDYMTCGNIPVWFTEGVALYEEYHVYDTEWAPGKRYGNFYGEKELESNFYTLDEIKAYRQSFLVVRHVAENFGMDAIIDITEELRNGKSMDQAGKRILGMNVNEIFEKSLKGSYLLYLSSTKASNILAAGVNVLLACLTRYNFLVKSRSSK